MIYGRFGRELFFFSESERDAGREASSHIYGKDGKPVLVKGSGDEEAVSPMGLSVAESKGGSDIFVLYDLDYTVTTPDMGTLAASSTYNITITVNNTSDVPARDVEVRNYVQNNTGAYDQTAVYGDIPANTEVTIEFGTYGSTSGLNTGNLSGGSYTLVATATEYSMSRQDTEAFSVETSDSGGGGSK